MAVDFNLGEKQNDPASREKVLRLALSQLGGVVVYKNFIHAAGRSGSGAFVDMTHVQGPVEAKCDSFEFARVRQCAVGRPKGQEKNYLAAWVGNEIYVYFVKSIREDGLLDKEISVCRTPDGFQGFLPGGGLSYKTNLGVLYVLSIDIR